MPQRLSLRPRRRIETCWGWNFWWMRPWVDPFRTRRPWTMRRCYVRPSWSTRGRDSPTTPRIVGIGIWPDANSTSPTISSPRGTTHVLNDVGLTSALDALLQHQPPSPTEDETPHDHDDEGVVRKITTTTTPDGGSSWSSETVRAVTSEFYASPYTPPLPDYERIRDLKAMGLAQD